MGVGERNIASVYVAGKLIASGSSDNKKNAKLHAAEAAVTRSKAGDATTGLQTFGDFGRSTETESAKQKVNELCNKKKWPKPIYIVEQELGPAHDKKYVSSVQVGNFFNKGEEKSRVKEAENSAAYCALREYDYYKSKQANSG